MIVGFAAVQFPFTQDDSTAHESGPQTVQLLIVVHSVIEKTNRSFSHKSSRRKIAELMSLLSCLQVCLQLEFSG